MNLEFWQLGVLEDPGPLLLVTLSSSLTLSGLCNKDSAARAAQGKKEMGLFFFPSCSSCSQKGPAPAGKQGDKEEGIWRKEW